MYLFNIAKVEIKLFEFQLNCKIHMKFMFYIYSLYRYMYAVNDKLFMRRVECQYRVQP